MDSAARWRKKLIALKADNPNPDFTWHGYDILFNRRHIEALLGGRHQGLFAEIAGQPIADIGAADADLAYFPESLGFEADLIDWPATNCNGLRGARRLGELLDSLAGIHEVDLDRQFHLPRQRYGLVFVLGILYHLKNPFCVLERLARSTSDCFVSTRIACQTADRAVALERAPLAYLLDPTECNNDSTNYWIFSMPGLLRLVDRCGGDVVEPRRVGDTRASNPWVPEHDERAFLLLESRH